MKFNQIKQLYDDYTLPVYPRQEVCFVRGEGVRLWDSEHKEYLDFAAGLGVNSVGYAHPDWIKAVVVQAAMLPHTSNLYYTEPGALLAQKLCELSGLRQVFFANSGAEANEGLVKLARKYSADKYKDPKRHKIVTLRNSFHGRTHSTLAATGQDVFHLHFQPLGDGFIHVPAGDVDALCALDDDVCAVLLEPIQGEGGVLPLSREYLWAVSELCAQRDWLMMCDEVQTGIARTGPWFAFQDKGAGAKQVKPDAVSFAKGIAGGLPLGGVIVGEKAAGVFTTGLHGSTFGGNPLCCAAALATLKILEGAQPTVAERGEHIKGKLRLMNLPALREIRGRGLMLALSIDGDPKAVQKELLQNGLVCLTAGADAIRLLPPLTVSKPEIDEGLEILRKVLTKGDQA